MIPLFLQAQHGLGHHAETISSEERMKFNQLNGIESMIPLMSGIGFLKIAIALELLKLKSASWRWYTIALWCLIGAWPFSAFNLF